MPRKPPKDDTVYLADMLRAAEAVSSFISGRSLADYLRDLLLRSAVERQVEIIGEAARRICKPFQEAHPEIALLGITSQRHVLAHDYGEILDKRIWRVASIRVPELIDQLRPLIPPPPL